ncbi:MAG: 50S ribosomal protein L10 [Candidatus Latescibacterota bacterium]|nr:50S ribosomal protein L10 [Candidatus Latescibacterota bacterium]MEE2726324.1 50S ribosomal protein L10 [Candidatus Latescibacterota bacterium]
MPTSEKVDKVEELTAAMSNAKAIYLADFTGLDVAKVTGLRNKLREAEVGYQVVKNRLAKRAAAEAGISGLDEHLIGPTAIAFSTEDPIAPAKILQDFADEDDTFSIKTGFMDGRVLSPDEIKALSKLPSREELLGKVLGSVQSPMYGLAGVLNGLLRNLVGVVAAIEEKQKTGDAE